MSAMLREISILHLVEAPGQGGAARASQRIQEALSAMDGVTSVMGYFEGHDSLLGPPDAIRLDSKARFFQNELANWFAFAVRHLIPQDLRNLVDFLFIRDRGLEDFLETLAPDYVLVHWVRPRRFGLRSIRRVGCKVIFVLHDLRPVLGLRHYPSRGWARLISAQFTYPEKWAARRIRALLPPRTIAICPSNWIADACEYLGWAGNAVVRIPYPVDIEFWRPLQERKSQQMTRCTRFGFGYFGVGADWRKGGDLVFESFGLLEEHLKETNTHVELLLFGDAFRAPTQSAFVSTKTIGQISDLELRQLYSELDYLLVPSRIENLAQVALEAQSCGLPCIVMGQTGLTSTVGYASSIIITEPTPQAVADAMLKAIASPDKTRLMAIASRKSATENFKPDTVALSYLDLFD